MDAADYLEINSLMNDGQVFIDVNFVMITATEAFKNLSKGKLSILLAKDSLNVPNEQTVFESLLSWISAYPQERSKDLEDLLPHIRAHFLPRHFIDHDVKTFLKRYSNVKLLQKLDHENKTPRYGYEEYILVVLGGGGDHGDKCLMYLDTKVGHHNMQSKTYCRLLPDRDMDTSSRCSSRISQGWM